MAHAQVLSQNQPISEQTAHISHIDPKTSLQTAQTRETASQQEIEERISYYSELYGVDSKLVSRIIRCESGGNPMQWNKTDPHGGAKGLAQFLQPTFDSYSKKAGIEHGDIWNTDDQLQTMAYMFSIGEAKQWSCYNR